MKKRTILTGLAAFVALAVSSVLLASSDGGSETCDSKAKGCITRMDYSCYFFLQNARGISAEDRCWYDDHDFSSPI